MSSGENCISWKLGQSFEKLNLREALTRFLRPHNWTPIYKVGCKKVWKFLSNSCIFLFYLFNCWLTFDSIHFLIQGQESRTAAGTYFCNVDRFIAQRSSRSKSLSTSFKGLLATCWRMFCHKTNFRRFTMPV